MVSLQCVLCRGSTRPRRRDDSYLCTRRGRPPCGRSAPRSPMTPGRWGWWRSGSGAWPAQCVAVRLLSGCGSGGHWALQSAGAAVAGPGRAIAQLHRHTREKGSGSAAGLGWAGLGWAGWAARLRHRQRSAWAAGLPCWLLHEGTLHTLACCSTLLFRHYLQIFLVVNCFASMNIAWKGL